MSDSAKSTSTIPLFQPKSQTELRGSFERAYASQPIETYVEAYDRCGSIFKIDYHGSQRLAMGGVEANRLIWGDKTLWDYPKTNQHFREQFNDRYLNQLEGREYVKKRKRVTAGFKPSMLMSHVPAMSAAIERLVDDLPDGRADLRLLCMRAIIAMTSRALMQVDLPTGMDQTMAISNKMMLKGELLGPWRHLYYLRPDRIYRRQKIFRYLGSIIEQRERDGTEGDDVLSLSLNAHPKDEPPIPRKELVHDLSQLMMAGSTTTSHTILWHLLLTRANPEWEAQIQAELANWSPGNFTNMGDWPKLKAACLEVERLRPPSMLFHRMTARAFDFQGYHIPKGVWVAHLQTLGHFLPECYEDPLVFKPERFLEDSDLPKRDVHGLFGGGAHVCAGFPLARILAPVAVATLLTHYDIEFETPVETDARVDVMLAPPRPPMVRFRRK
jgi:cytochrome P450